MRIIMKYLKPYYLRMALGLAIKFVGTMMDLMLPWILAYTIDSIIPLKSVKLILIWGGVMVICSVCALITNVIANRMASRVARDTTRAIRHDLFSKITYLSCRQIDEFTVPSLESRLTTDTYNINQLVGMAQRIGVRAPILLLGGIVITLTLEPVLSLIMILNMPIIGFLVYIVSKKGIPLYTQMQKAVDSMVRTVRENISGIRVIKALSKTEYEKQRFSDIVSEVVKREKKASLTMAITNPVMNLILNLGLTVVIIAGAYRVNAGLTQPGKIIAFMTYFTIILNAMLILTRLFIMSSKGIASAERISDVLEAEEDIREEEKDHIDDGNHISFENVSFSYNKGKEVIRNISFALKKGETLGIIGATGCGKSTLVRLLMRLYDTDKGVIRINGDNIRSIPAKELYTKFGVVFQNDVLFSDTIEENISFGRGLDREQIKSAAEYAQAKEFIDSLPDGYNHMLTIKGANLSGGQKQRLLISRALAAKPEILILDDSSSALDYKTDSLLRSAIEHNFRFATSIFIAQRVSSIMNADHILYLDEGEALGYGTHKELMESCEEYREIAVTQLGGEEIA